MIGKKITEGKTYLGIELGSTRIKACLIDDSFKPVAGGAWGMALLAAYAVQNDKSGLGQWLEASVFENAAGETLYPVTEETEQFGEFFKLYKAGLSAAGKLKNVSGKNKMRKG